MMCLLVHYVCGCDSQFNPLLVLPSLSVVGCVFLRAMSVVCIWIPYREKIGHGMTVAVVAVAVELKRKWWPVPFLDGVGVGGG